MSEATQALTLDFTAIEDADPTSTKEEVWGRLISLNSAYQNVDLSGNSHVQLMLSFAAGDQYKMGRQSSCEIRFEQSLNIHVTRPHFYFKRYDQWHSL